MQISNIHIHTLENRKKIIEKIKGCTYKITNISPAMCSNVSNFFCISVYFYYNIVTIFLFLFVLLLLRPKSTAMVMAGWSVHLTTLFPGQA